MIGELAVTDLDLLDDEGLRVLLRAVQPQLDRLTALRAKVAGELSSRLARQAGPGREARGVRDARDFLRNELRLAPSDAKRTEETGSRLKEAPAAATSFADGALSQDHVRVITDTVRRLTGDARTDVEHQLVEAAARQDPVELGRTARRLLAEYDHAAAVADEERKQARRYGRMTQTADGAVAVSAMLYGVAAERALAAWHAFHRPRSVDDHRSNDQRGADVLEEILDVALRSGRAPTRHGVRPHVEIVVRYEDLLRGAGVAELGFTGPITIDQVHRLLADCTLSRVVVGPDSMPLEVSRKVRTVPAALWTALKLRDGGCAWHGCDAPPGWCEVAHAFTPWHAGGKLSLDTAVLLCKRHHRQFDSGGWTVTIRGPDVTFHPPPAA